MLQIELKAIYFCKCKSWDVVSKKINVCLLPILSNESSWEPDDGKVKFSRTLFKEIKWSLQILKKSWHVDKFRTLLAVMKMSYLLLVGV